MKPYFDDGQCVIYHGDCREILPTLGTFDLLLTDPPYGIGHSPQRGGAKIHGDGEPFRPCHLLAVAKISVLFGANNFAELLPPSHGWIVWDKRCGAPRQTQGDGELAWTDGLGATRIIRCSWNGGGSRRRETKSQGAKGVATSLHPTQKPVALMTECLSFFPDTESVVDPYMGSGPVARACKDGGQRYVGIEIEERYCEVAAKRLSQQTFGLSLDHHDRSGKS